MRDKVECPDCHREVGTWKNKINFHCIAMPGTEDHNGLSRPLPCSGSGVRLHVITKLPEGFSTLLQDYKRDRDAWYDEPDQGLRAMHMNAANAMARTIADLLLEREGCDV